MHVLRYMHMKRTSILIPDDLKRQAERTAKERDISFSALVRDLLRREVARGGDEDPFFSDDAVFRGPAPVDGVARLDDYVYGEEGSRSDVEA